MLNVDVGCLDYFLTTKSMIFQFLKHFKIILKYKTENFTSYFWTFADCQDLHFEHHWYLILNKWKKKNWNYLLPGFAYVCEHFVISQCHALKLSISFDITCFVKFLWWNNRVIFFTFSYNFYFYLAILDAIGRFV